MKHLFLSVLLSLLFATAAYAEQVIIKANENGQVIVNEEMSIDGNEYILNAAEPQQEYAVQQMSATTFSVNSYEDGFFDNYQSLIESSNLNAHAYDNDINTKIDTQNKTYKVTFKKNIDITGFYYFFGGGSLSVYVNFLNDKDELIKSFELYNYMAGGTENVAISDVKSVVVHGSVYVRDLKEFDLFVDPVSIYASVSNLEINNIKHSSADVVWKNPDDASFVDNAIYVNDVLVADYLTTDSFNLSELKEDTEYKITLRSNYADGKFVDVNTTFLTGIDTSVQKDVSNLKVVQDGDNAFLSWDNPTNANFDYLKIYRSGVLIEENFKENNYTDTELKKNVNYRYTVIAVSKNGLSSPGINIRFVLAGEDVYNVVAKATAADVVDIVWSNPANADLQTVKIYRKKKSKGVAVFASLFNADDYQPLFQTNGTTFTDLTVAPDSTYTYKLATVIASAETEGVEVEVKTPKVKVGGDTIDAEKNENGDEFYVVKWTSPSSGKLKVLVGGAEYAVVNAADKQIKIPKADMVYTAVGTPDVSLVPVDENGVEIGVPSQPAGGLGDISLSDAGLDASNILLITMWLLAIVLSIILLAMAFRVTPKIIELIYGAFK